MGIKIKDKSFKFEGEVTLKQILYEIEAEGRKIYLNTCGDNDYKAGYHKMREIIGRYLEMIK